MSNTNFTNLYKVQKTITFELKAVQEVQGVNFSKSQALVQRQYFGQENTIDSTLAQTNINVFVDEVIDITKKFVTNLRNGNYSLEGLLIHKRSIEKCDRVAYHQLKKINTIELSTKDGYSTFLQRVKMSGVNELDLILKMLNLKGPLFLTERLEKLISRVEFYYLKISKDIQSRSDSTTVHLYSGHTIFYSNWRIYLSMLDELLDILVGLEANPRFSESNQITRTLINNLNWIKSDRNRLEKAFEKMSEDINEEAKKPIILSSLNPRAVNKDPSKIEKEYSKILEYEIKKEQLETELSALNQNKFEKVETLDQKLKSTVSNLKILMDPNVLEIHQKNSRGEALTSNELDQLKEFKLAKRVLKYIKFSGVLVTCKDDIEYYGKPKERPNKELKSVKLHPQYTEFQKEYEDYYNLCASKKAKSEELGDIRNLYNALRREVLRQKEMNYLSVLIKDAEFYYLVLIDKEYNRSNNIVELIKSNQASGWRILNYNKITFKALEKLALLDESTFDIKGKKFDTTIKKIYKTKLYKPKEEGWTMNRDNYDNLERLIDYCKDCLTLIPDASKYNFNFKSTNKYECLDDFADDLDRQGYSSSWSNLDITKLTELEAIDDGNVLIFKLHNQDFRRDKIQDKLRKINLFTKYWQDAMLLGQEIRINPEIDVMKRNKEAVLTPELVGESTNIKHKRYFENKIYAAFNLEFYPKNNLRIDQKKQFQKINEDTINENSKTPKSYYLGLDRGEKELVSWSLIDESGQLIQNGDWTTLNGYDYTQNLAKYQTKKIELFKAYSEVSECVDINQKVELEKLAKNIQTEFQNEGMLAAETIKKGYCSHLINQINEVLVQYPNIYIVLEDLDMKYNADGTPKVREDENTDNKAQNLQKTMGGTVYQAIENAIVNKFKYHTIKNSEGIVGLQRVPNISKVGDLRVKEIVSKDDNRGFLRVLNSKSQIGNILFVDEENTSRTCPNCNYCVDKKFRELVKNSKVEIFLKNSANIEVKIDTYIYKLPNNEYLQEKAKNFIINNVNNHLDSNTKKSQILEILEFRFKSGNNAFTDESKKDDFVHCPTCGFASTNNRQNSKLFTSDGFEIKSGDDVAAYNIAKRGLEFITKNK